MIDFPTQDVRAMDRKQAGLCDASFIAVVLNDCIFSLPGNCMTSRSCIDPPMQEAELDTFSGGSRRFGHVDWMWSHSIVCTEHPHE